MPPQPIHLAQEPTPADPVPTSAGARRLAGSLAAVAYDLMVMPRAPHPVPAISVVVPTHERRALVLDTLDAFARQRVDDPYEVIVVDNGSTDGTAEALADAASRLPFPLTVARLRRDCGPAVARNVGVSLARGPFVAFTDSDCLPAEGWLAACLSALRDGYGIVQGRTAAPPGAPQPFFSHFIETLREDGSFSTSNVAYRREDVIAVGGFDATCEYWEDVDLGWRVTRAGARRCFVPDACVYHQVLPVSPLAWLWHTRRYGNWPAKAARYPEFRHYLVMGLWVDRLHACFTLFVFGLLLSLRHRAALVLMLPYVLAFALTRGVTGRWPPVKVLAHLARDVVAVLSLLYGSLRHRSPVL